MSENPTPLPGGPSSVPALAAEVLGALLRLKTQAQILAGRSEAVELALYQTDERSSPAYDLAANLAEVTRIAANDLEAALLRAVLAFDPGVRDRDVFALPRTVRPARGVRVGSELLLAMPIPNRGHPVGYRSPDVDVMFLATVPAAAIETLESQEAL